MLLRLLVAEAAGHGAGSRALLVTHWSIGEAPSAYLIAEFLSRLQQDPTAGVAKVLRATQIGLLDDAGKGLPADFAHPFFWAPFAVTGDDGARLRTARQENPATPFHG